MEEPITNNFLFFELYCFTPPQIFQSNFPGVEFSIRPDAFFSLYNVSIIQFDEEI